MSDDSDYINDTQSLMKKTWTLEIHWGQIDLNSETTLNANASVLLVTFIIMHFHTYDLVSTQLIFFIQYRGIQLRLKTIPSSPITVDGSGASARGLIYSI